MTLTCEDCGATFEARNRRLKKAALCKKCQQKRHNESGKVEATCVGCGVLFMWRERPSKQAFHSRDCFQQWFKLGEAVCGGCGKGLGRAPRHRVTPETATLDHKIPMSRGGQHVLSNLQWISKDVNAAKGTMTHEEFLHLCTEVAERYNRNGHST